MSFIFCHLIECLFIGLLTFDALKSCFQDKAKVTLSLRDGNKLWRIFDNGQQLSTGLNVLVGGRSTGKTHTLNKIQESVKSVKYIRQFSLVQENDEREFTSSVERRRSAFVDHYLAGFKRVVDEVSQIDLDADERKIAQYLRITTLLELLLVPIIYFIQLRFSMMES